ncbi:MAG: rhomboid family intramembrane serine protease [Rubrivivax sp.]|nr:rhomboid family intramembrane serine protease [Rubrivivax sp.]
MPTLPPTTKAVILACVALFCIDVFVRLTGFFALWPLGSGNFFPWQMLTYAGLHGDVAHLFFNMLGLWIFGADLERLWGRARYLTFLAVCVVVAATAQLLVTSLIGSKVATVGASGALFGLLLAYALSFPRRQFDLVGFIPVLFFMVPNTIVNMLGFALYIMLLTNRSAVPIPPVPVPAMTMVVIFGAIELVLGLYFRAGAGVAHFAHLGGMLGGWLMMQYWRGRGPFKRRR